MSFYGLTKDQIEEFKEVFMAFDQENNGFVTTKELGSLLKMLGVSFTPESLKAMTKKHDLDESGTIDFREFLVLMAEISKEETVSEESLRESFKVFFRDNPEATSAAELRYILTGIGEMLSDEEADELLRRLDVGENGLVKFDDFVRVMLGQGKK